MKMKRIFILIGLMLGIILISGLIILVAQKKKEFTISTSMVIEPMEQEIEPQKTDVSSQEISVANLNEAKEVAQSYLNLIKSKKYKKATTKFSYIPADYSRTKIEEENRYFVEVMKIYNEELGNIVNYNYKDYKWEGTRRWTSDRIDQASLTLIYEVQYTKDRVDTTIKIVKQDNELKVSSFGISYPPTSEGMQKQIKLFEKLEKSITPLKEETQKKEER